jgi:ABC-2 type transport system permease protein
MDRYIIPVKREMWEHNGAFVKAPLVIFILLCISIFVAIAVGRVSEFSHSYHYESNTGIQQDASVREFDYSDIVIGEQDAAALQHSASHPPYSNKDVSEASGIINNISYMAFSGILFFISIVYLLGCLSADRKDGSILFWKSMPVSETQNVLTKIVVATCVLPAIAWVCALAFSAVLLVSVAVLAVMSGFDGVLAIVWSEQTLIGSAWQYIGAFLAAALWRLPLVAWLLLASASAKKTPFLLAFFPLLGVVVFEKIVFGSMVMFSLFMEYIIPNFSAGSDFGQGWGDLWVVATSIQFWLGTFVAAGMLLGVIWLRENRYEN